MVSTIVLLVGQSPAGRATTLTLYGTAMNLGVALGVALGGLALARAGYVALGLYTLALPLAVVLFAGLALDGQLSCVDGAVLLGGFGLAVLYLLRLGRRGLGIKPWGEVGHRLQKGNLPGKWPAMGLFVLSLAAIAVGSEMLVRGAHTLLTRLHIADLPFGMTILAFVVSIEELERELPAARQGRPDISFGNVLGSVLAIFLCNAGIIALVRPLQVDRSVLTFYLPVAFITTAVVSGFMLTKGIPRWAGGVLLLLYGLFVTGAWFL
jgi:cation:H+ antiporter